MNIDMKKILLTIFSFAAAVFAMSSCSKETPAEHGDGEEELIITATIAGAGTKVTFAEQGSSPVVLHPSWTVGDVVIGFDNASKTYGFEVTAVDGTTGKATLKLITAGTDAGSATVNPSNGTMMYMIYAPGKHPSDISANSLTVSLASQSADVVPALMMAEGTVADGKLSLVFTNETVIIGIKDPVMNTGGKSYTAFTVTATTSSSLGIDTKVVFSLDGGHLKASYQSPGDIIKTVNFTSDATTRKGPAITWLAVCPLSSPADLYFVADDNESYGMVIDKLEKGHYYHTTPVFGPPEMGLDFNNLTDSGLI